MATVLIVEDERVLGQACQSSLAGDGHAAHWVANAEEAMEWLEGRQIDLALIDLGLPGMDGLEFLKRVRDSHPDAAFVMMTARGDVPTAVRAMRLGACDFLLKPLDLETVSLVANKNLSNSHLARSWKHEQKSRTQRFGLHQLLGECSAIEKAKGLVRRLSSMDVAASQEPPNVLITGETGTGKGMLARAFHYEGPRRGGPFIQVNCAALPEGLVESELFGHVKGAFTSATSNKRGLFEVASQGTLFLDEVGSLSLPLQAKLLTAVETRRIRPIGATVEQPIDIQLIAAMNEVPTAVVADGGFREDLYHRLCVIQTHLPPLRERGRDIDLLAEHFLASHCRKFGLSLKRLSPQARNALRRYHWPGNVRELGNQLESAVLLSDEAIDADVLPRPQRTAIDDDPGADDTVLNVDFSKGPVSLATMERELIVRAMAATDYNVSRAAALIDVSRDTLRYRVEKYGIPTRKNGAGS